MIKLFYSMLIIYGSLPFFAFAEHHVKSEQKRQELLLCRKCGTDVADSYYLFSKRSPGARKSEWRELFGKSNVTVQTLVNPFGVQFEVVTIEKARCHNIGHPQGADSWFPGYSWRICTCPHCGAHLGWTFENSTSGVSEKSTLNTFHGLILSHILGENYPERFSSWLRLLRSAAAVLKFISRCRKLTCDDSMLMAQAERLLPRQAQADSFGNEIAEIKKGKCVQRDSRLINLSPYLDEEGLLRVGGRIDAVSDVPMETKRPVILDGRHPLTRLLVRHRHGKAAHGNQETVVNDLKREYWLLRLRPTVKNVVSRCMLCRLRRAKPVAPRMGDLPGARLAHHQRVDLFGPMEVVVGRRREKRYGVLFTCLTVRAIHTEVVHSLTTDSLIMALRRMASRRGWPTHYFSDNGTNLRGAHTELKRSMQEINNDALKLEAINNRAQWTFLPPRSPHWGGAWERLIRSVKASLGVILRERAPRDEVLLTLLAEVENIVNGRPLTHVSVEPGSSEALTPNHFLLGSSTNLPTVGEFDDSDLYLRKKWRNAQRLADMYWRRWLKEYLPLLLPRKKWQQDLVLFADPDSPRNVWPRGIIKTIFPGRDGRVRVVEVSTPSGVLRRAAARVAPVPLVE